MNIRVIFISLIIFQGIPELFSQNKMIINFENEQQFIALLNDSAIKNLSELKIQIEENLNSWVLYTNLGTDTSTNNPLFNLKHPIDKLPNLDNLTSLEILDISFLGLNSIPFNGEKLINLRELNISFNYLEIEQIIPEILNLKNLNTLKIFGLNLTEEEYFNLKKMFSKIKIYYSKDDLINSMNDK